MLDGIVVGTGCGVACFPLACSGAVAVGVGCAWGTIQKIKNRALSHCITYEKLLNKCHRVSIWFQILIVKKNVLNKTERQRKKNGAIFPKTKTMSNVI